MTVKNNIRIYSIYLLRLLLRVFFLCPIDKKKIVFCAFGGTKIACNPYYVYLHLIEKYPNGFNVYWVLNKDDRSRIREHDVLIYPKGIKFFYHLLTASVIVDNDGFKSYIPFRKKQMYINTWHGGGLFKTAYGASRSAEEVEYNQKIDKIKKGDVKLLLSTSSLWSKHIARYRFQYEGEILESGYPRNDLFFHENKGIAQKVKDNLGIDTNAQIVLFAPTYRGGLFNRHDSDCIDGLNVSQLTDSLEKRFGGKFIFVYRGHHAAHKASVNNCIDATNYVDMQELLVAADVFISDYSSCLWDFSLTYKPCLIFAPDFEEYKKDPGFESDYKEWPFPIAKSNEELNRVVISYNEKKNKEDINKYHALYGSCETGHASEMVVSRIVEFLSK